MKRFAGFMMILTLPLLCLCHLLAIVVALPFFIGGAFLTAIGEVIHELFDMRNTISFVSGVVNKAYDLAVGKQ